MLVQAPVEPAVVAALQALEEGKAAAHDHLLGLLGEVCRPRYDLPVRRVGEPLCLVAADPGEFRGQGGVVLLGDGEHRVVARRVPDDADADVFAREELLDEERLAVPERRPQGADDIGEFLDGVGDALLRDAVGGVA
ncbi:hypothetical protein DSECCO2_475970 [anaerobic digester metagenome]